MGLQYLIGLRKYKWKFINKSIIENKETDMGNIYGGCLELQRGQVIYIKIIIES